MALGKALEWGKCDWFQINKDVRRKCFQGSENFTITMGEIQPGKKPGPHKHFYEQTAIILKGKCDFHIEDEVYTLSGDLEDGGISFLTIPPDKLHWIENPYDEPCLNMDIFCPKRAEDRPESVQVR